MNFRFKPEHFSKLDLIPDGEDLRLWVVIADQANRILRSYVKTLPEVYGHQLKESGLTDEHGPGWIFAEESARMEWKNTHRARLWGVEEVKTKKRACEHEIVEVIDYSRDSEGLPTTAECCACGKWLMAEWAEWEEAP